ncbi:MAG TPA: M50 family metallopeptidase [Bacillota bacterium]|nr:M50 family metallopeptidase [Bacillota bacterium]
MTFWETISNTFSFVPTILLTILVFGILILVHEFGHYIAARAFKVGVNEFSIGMGPKMFQFKGKYNPFTIRWLPIGGYVNMVGETEEEEEADEEKKKVALNTKPKWQRFIIMIAGVTMNFLLAFIVMFFLVLSMDIYASTTVGAFDEASLSNSGATELNRLEEGDKILKVNGMRVYVYYEMAYKIMSDGIEPVDILVERDGKKVLLEGVVFPEQTSQGILFGSVDFKVNGIRKTVGQVLYQSVFQAVATFRVTVASLMDTLSGRYGISGVSGPVGVAGEIGEAASAGISSLASLLVLLSVSIGVFNLIPLPALDGGRVLFLIIEAIIRRPLPKKVETAAITVSMVLLLLLTAAITLKDITGLF